MSLRVVVIMGGGGIIIAATIRDVSTVMAFVKGLDH